MRDWRTGKTIRAGSCWSDQQLLRGDSDPGAITVWGSVLGPTLWNIAYDSVLRTPMPGGFRVVFFADDTALLSSVWDLSQAIMNAERDLDVIVKEIEGLGLKVAPQKTVAMAFPASALRTRRNVPLPKICFRGVSVVVKTRRDPLGAPLWGAGVVACCRGRHENRAGCSKPPEEGGDPGVLCIPDGLLPCVYDDCGDYPLMHLAPRLAETYAAIRDAEEPVSPRAKAVLGALARRRAVEAWRAEEIELLESPATTGERVRTAVAEWLAEWIERPFCISTTFHTTQLMTGHGCFAAYLFKIRKIPTPQCLHRGEGEDTAEHTLVDCPAWTDDRSELVNTMGGGQLSLPAIVRASLTVPGGWAAFRTFAGQVMRAEEDAERRRERARKGRVCERAELRDDGSANDRPHRRVAPE
ncbi:uncharacterized protein LOC124432620 [Vespa crabro]|uniref:uncharacterized protein LOC124432620 n=1 Tax=Vespa crabro TaxID=7445 RepID=UPI001F01A951|nr:uncharacterized protein LOC124432620 [Vespa crabro]